MKTYMIIIISFISCHRGYGQVSTDWNLDFEEWEFMNTGTNLTDTIINDHNYMIPQNWYFRSDHSTEGSGIGQTTDSQNGNYAVTLSGFYQYQVMRIISGNSIDIPGWPIDYRPIELNGDYKAILLCSTCDSLRVYVDVYLTKYSTQQHKIDTIGQGHIILKETANEYNNFNVPVDYLSNNQQLPDSVTIVLAKERFGFGSQSECWECSHVYLDNFSLPVVTSSLDEYENIIDGFECYPNPISDIITIKNNSPKPKYFQVFDVMGRIIFNVTIENNSEIKIETKHTPNSILFVTDGVKTKKVLVTK